MRAIAVLCAVVALGALDLCSGCTSAVRSRVETAAADVLLPPEEEKQLGLQVENELSSQVRFVNDSVVDGYVQDIVGKVLVAARKDNPELAVRVHVIDDPKTVNAFATPGQQLYVYTGLLVAAQSDAQVAGVLGHEMGHIVARHPARQMVDAFGLQALSAAVLGHNAPLIQQLVANVAAKGFLLANSRADETEADETGARYASAAGFDPNALAAFLKITSAGAREPSGMLAWLSDHPTTPNRIEHLRAYIAEHDLRGTVEGNGVRTVQQALRAVRPE